MKRTALEVVQSQIEACKACPRLVRFREKVAREKRLAYATEKYAGRAVAGFGDPNARIIVFGLAPGAHGANRTGRVFTGDRSGDFLFAALHRAKLASQPTSAAMSDGLRLDGVYITLAVRCVPPDNRPSPAEIRRCAHWLDDELAHLARARVVLALGSIGFAAAIAYLGRRGATLPKKKPAFAHGTEIVLGGATIVASYHVSQQNTATGTLTPTMFDAVVARTKKLADYT